MERKHKDYQAILPQLQVLLYTLLVIIAGIVILYVIFSVLNRFYGTILLFIFGAILAYLLIPIVNRVQMFVRKRWAAILTVYIGVFIAMSILAVVLLNPFVRQAQSLAHNLQHPSQASLRSVASANSQATRIEAQIASESKLLADGISVPPSHITRTRADIAALRSNVSQWGHASHLAASPLGASIPSTTQTQVPPSYAKPILTATEKLAADYRAATRTPASVSKADLRTAAASAQAASKAAASTLSIMSSTPVLLLDLQRWLDDHGLKIDIHQRFGSAASQVNDQAASLVNNAANIVLTAGTLMLNAFLMLIISVYLLSDGPRLVRRMTQIGPPGFRSGAPFYVASLDKVMGGYIRGQIGLATLAAFLGAVGAWILGVPYAVLIGLSTFFLILIPVIGAVILIVPPVLIALIFTPLPTPIYLLIYYVVMMQIVTNVIGPKVVGSAVGIHPLEAMAAALVGYPIAGILGSFLAVPILGFIHIAVRQAYHDFGRREIAELQAELSGEPEPLPALTGKDTPPPQTLSRSDLGSG
jgi:predicted PurR-regulated permease PerM